jgi:hypothetical protein
MTTSTLSLEQVVRTARQRHDALSPFDATDQLPMYQYRFPDGGAPAMERLTKDRTLILSPRAETQLLQRVGVPVTFFRRLPENLKWAIANHFVQNGLTDRAALIRTVRGNTVRALLTEAYTPLDDIDILPVVADILGDDDVVIEKLDFADDATHLRVLFPRQTTEARAGDVLTTGIHITNSETGYRAVHVDALVHRLVCTNGLVRAENQGRTTLRHVGQVDRLKDYMARAIRDARDNAQQLVREFRDSVGHTIADPEELLRGYAKDSDLTRDQLQAALAAFGLEPERTLYGAVNALTRAAQAEATFEDRYQMERAATALLTRVGR